MSCARPIDAATLADYWLAALSQTEKEAVEEHLLECDGCGARLREVMAFAAGVRRLAREGSLRMVVTDEFLRRVSGEGLRVREYAPPPGGSVQCTVTAEEDILIGRLAADLTAASQGRGARAGRVYVPPHTLTAGAGRLVAGRRGATGMWR